MQWIDIEIFLQVGNLYIIHKKLIIASILLLIIN